VIDLVKPKIYIETTIFSYYFLEEKERRQDRMDTVELIREIDEGRFDAFISNIVIAEIDRCLEPKRTNMVKLINDHPIYILEGLPGYIELAEKYISEKVIPVRKRNDALHIAIAAVNGLDVLVSWNCKHIVRYKTKKLVNIINEIVGYKRIDFNTPREVIER
jgi:predicted nucleic acid-binding protein